MKTLEIGIASYDQMKARTLAIVRGEHTPAKGEPKAWFTLIESFAKLLSEHNRHLLELIAREQPRSLTELADLAGRSKSNLSRTLKTMSRTRAIAAWRARHSGAPGPLRPGAARCLVDGDEERICRHQPLKPLIESRSGRDVQLRYAQVVQHDHGGLMMFPQSSSAGTRRAFASPVPRSMSTLRMSRNPDAKVWPRRQSGPLATSLPAPPDSQPGSAAPAPICSK